jgi:hypothetical protein
MNETQVYSTTRNTREIHQPDSKLRPYSDMIEYYQQYARERPEVCALWCLGIGFVLGWKLKPW